MTAVSALMIEAENRPTAQAEAPKKAGVMPESLGKRKDFRGFVQVRLVEKLWIATPKGQGLGVSA